jgi:hypothetical protein
LWIDHRLHERCRNRSIDGIAARFQRFESRFDCLRLCR